MKRILGLFGDLFLLLIGTLLFSAMECKKRENSPPVVKSDLPGILPEGSGVIELTAKVGSSASFGQQGIEVFIALSRDSLQNKKYDSRYTNPKLTNDSGIVRYYKLPLNKAFHFYARLNDNSGVKISADTFFVSGTMQLPKRADLILN